MDAPGKQCCRCNRLLPSSRQYFYADKRAADGLYGHCKSCHSANLRRRYQGDERKKTLARQNQYRKDHPERRKAVVHKSDRKRREKRNAWMRRRNQSERGQQYQRDYRENNRNKRSIWAQKRNACKISKPIDFTAADWQYALDHFGGCCAVCGRSLYGVLHSPAIDHWIPISNPACPGTVVTNIIPLCHGIGGCNNSKHDRDPEEWLASTYGPKRAREILNRINSYFILFT